MSANPSILRRTIVSRMLPVHGGGDAADAHLLAALPLDQDGKAARLYFRNTVKPEDGAGQLPPGVIWSRNVSGSSVLDVTCAGNGQAVLPLSGQDLAIDVAATETALFAGRNVILGHQNGETAHVALQWLLWHRRNHAADGALIVNRGAPGDAGRMATEMAALLQDDDAARRDLAAMTVMIVDFDTALGDAAAGGERHPMNAPDAPGKDRMDHPAPDAWHAPLAYRMLFDLMRHMFLSEARAVANLELMDLITRNPGQASVFDEVKQVPMGVLPLQGQRAFPWSLRNGSEAGFGDHICRRFDSAATERRWVVAPARLPKGAIWMMVRILGAKTSYPARPFWRFMALRYGAEGKVGQIVPKTSLVEDEELLSLAAARGAKPLRMPEDQAGEQPQEQKTAPGPRSDHVAIVTTMKNEGPFILEWIAYHRAIGVRDFLVYTNDCSDGTDDFLRLLEKKGYCQWRENPYRDSNMKPQHAALDAANHEPLIQNADWAICMDVDEYIAVHTGDGTLRALFDAVPDANLISFTWRLFGNSDIDEFRDEFITQNFLNCARSFCNKPHQAWGFKTLYRNDGLFKKLGVHRPKGLMPQSVDRINWVNGSGKAMPKDQWRNAWRSHAGTYGYDLVSLNHYAVRSAESFLVKRDRGRVNHVDRDQGMAYWFRMNHNVVRDERMKRMLPLLQAEYDRMMADPEIASMHRACVAAHRAKIEELKAQSNYQAFHAELNSPRSMNLSRLHGHFGSNIYLAGPEVIPDEIAAKSASDNFFFTVDHVDETQH